MAKNKIEGKETVEIFKELDRNVVQSERFIERNAKKIGGALGVVVLGVLAYLNLQILGLRESRIIFQELMSGSCQYITQV